MRCPIPDTDGNGPRVRITMLDVARFYGMVLVYYGHIIERFMYLGNPAATLHYKAIYSFHMVFFFLLSGYVCSPGKRLLPPGRFFKYMAASRLVPYFFFTAALAASALVFSGHFVVVDLSTPAGWLKGAVSTLLGFPVFNIPLWFLGCLVSVEVLHRLTARLTATDTGLWLTALACYVGGYWLNREVFFIGRGWNVWFLNEAPVVLAFYLVGVWMRRRGVLMGPMRRGPLLALAAVLLAVVVCTFNLNMGPFRMFDAVVIVLGAHGHPLWFPFTALAGSLLLLVLAKAVGNSRASAWMGENVLILFCLNGVFYHYLNGPFAAWATTQRLWTGPVQTTLAAAGFAALSLAACVPVIWAIRRWLPQVAGRPTQRGPLLPALLRPEREA